MDLVVDASNLRGGGGVTHLISVLAEGEPARSGIEAVEVWTGSKTASQISPRPWLRVRNHAWLDRGTLWRTLWQKQQLARELASRSNALLWVPGGSYVGSWRPFVTMSRSLLPFEPEARRYYRGGLKGLRLALLRRTQARTLHKSDGAIFLTDVARNRVLEQIGQLSCPTVTIYHGIAQRFFCEPRAPRRPEEFTREAPARILYVSQLSFYKHQIELMEAVAVLRARGLFVELNLIGPAGEAATKEAFLAAQARLDPGNEFVRFHGEVPHGAMSGHYRDADVFAFASSVETFGNILVEAMAAGLPIACSNRSAMPEVLGGAGLFFDPKQPGEIADAIEALLRDPALRAELAQRAYRRAGEFSWKKCADATFDFLAACYSRVAAGV